MNNNNEIPMKGIAIRYREDYRQQPAQEPVANFEIDDCTSVRWFFARKNNSIIFIISKECH